MKTERLRDPSTNEGHEQIANVASLKATLTTNGAMMDEDHLRPIPMSTTTLHLATCLHQTTRTVTLTSPMIGLCLEITHKLMLTMLLLNKLALKLKPKGKGKGKDLKDLECLKYLKYRHLPQAGLGGILSVSSLGSNNHSKITFSGCE